MLLCEQVLPPQVDRILRLLQIKSGGRANMLFGPSGTGKTTSWQVAGNVMLRLHEAYPDNPAYKQVPACLHCSGQ